MADISNISGDGATAVAGGKPDLRNVLQDILRLSMQGVAGMSNRAVDRIAIEFVTNPYGRQPPHILIFQDGRIERMTSFQLPVPGFGDNVLVIEALGAPDTKPTDAQCAAIETLGSEIRQLMPGRMSFAGYRDLVMLATGGIEPEQGQPSFMAHSEVKAAASFDRSAQAAAFIEQTSAATIQPEMPAAYVEKAPVFEATNVQQLFDILGTPDDRRKPVQPGSIFNTVSPVAVQGAGNTAVTFDSNSTQSQFRLPGNRTVTRLVVVASHDPTKPEPADAKAMSIKELRLADQRAGMSDFRGHYLIAKDGTLDTGRALDLTGNCWPGRNGDSIQIVIAGNGKDITSEQRKTLYDFAQAMCAAFEGRPVDANVRDVVLVPQLLGIDSSGKISASSANPAMITAPLPVNQQKRAG